MFSCFREGQKSLHSLLREGKCSPLLSRKGKCLTPRFREGQNVWGQMSGERGKCPFPRLRRALLSVSKVKSSFI